MRTNINNQGVAPVSRDMVGKGGPILGSITSIVGALLVLVGFVLPWASCGGYHLSGLDVVRQSSEFSQYGESGASLLCLVPFFALGILGVAVVFIPVSLWTRIAQPFKAIGPVLAGLLTALACCPACVFFLRLQSARNDPQSMGLGGLIQIEYGFWVTVFGLLVSFCGVAIGFATSLFAGRHPRAPTFANVPMPLAARRFCMQCGGENTPSARFCLHCGASLMGQ